MGIAAFHLLAVQPLYEHTTAAKAHSCSYDQLFDRRLYKDGVTPPQAGAWPDRVNISTPSRSPHSFCW